MPVCSVRRTECDVHVQRLPARGLRGHGVERAAKDLVQHGRLRGHPDLARLHFGKPHGVHLVAHDSLRPQRTPASHEGFHTLVIARGVKALAGGIRRQADHVVPALAQRHQRFSHRRIAEHGGVCAQLLGQCRDSSGDLPGGRMHHCYRSLCLLLLGANGACVHEQRTECEGRESSHLARERRKERHVLSTSGNG